MRISRHTGATVSEALARVKAELGPDAVILETAEADGVVTVTAAVDHAPLVEPASGDQELADKARQLVDVVRDLVVRPGRHKPAGPADLRRLQRRLASQGVDGAIAASLVRAVAERVAGGRDVEVAIAETVAASAAALAPARVEIFVGPPGDGKTTTIVKLAAAERARGRGLALVTTDTYRVGAVAELTAYGRALDVPVLVAADADELAAALAEAASAERVLVDTAGAGVAARTQLAELRALADTAGAEATRTLVLGAPTAGRAADDAWRAFSALQLDRCVVTKLDAASGAGVVGVCWKRGLAVSHVADGRRIPDDIEPATPARLVRCLVAA